MKTLFDTRLIDRQIDVVGCVIKGPYFDIMHNPYETPHALDDSTEKVWLRCDIGNLVGTYLQILALLSVVSILVQLALSRGMYIDLSVVFLYWAGVCLKRHSQVARTCVLVLSWLLVSVCVIFILIAAFFGTQSMTVRMGFRQIPNPSFLQILGVASVDVLLAGIPIVLLMSRQAKTEFAQKV